jgi:hypothetical protein
MAVFFVSGFDEGNRGSKIGVLLIKIKNMGLENPDKIREVSFIDDCLFVNSGIFEVRDGGEKRVLDLQGRGSERTYGRNNGKLAFVNEGGLYFVTTDSPERVQELQSMGFEDRGLFVPLSNNEVPADSNMYVKWKSIVEKK